MNGNGPPLAKIAVIAVVVIVLSGIMAAVTTLGGSEEAPAPVVKKPAPAAPKPSDHWSQYYGASFLYERQYVVVRSVKVEALKRSTAKVSYQITAVPRVSSEWLRDRNTWRLNYPGKQVAAYKVSQRKQGNKHQLWVYFRWPRRLAEKGSYLSIQFPGYRKVKGGYAATDRGEQIKLALEMPASHVGLEERSGDGGL